MNWYDPLIIDVPNQAEQNSKAREGRIGAVRREGEGKRGEVRRDKGREKRGGEQRGVTIPCSVRLVHSSHLELVRPNQFYLAEVLTSLESANATDQYYFSFLRKFVKYLPG